MSIADFLIPQFNIFDFGELAMEVITILSALVIAAMTLYERITK